jgi:hypothetical protein
MGGYASGASVISSCATRGPCNGRLAPALLPQGSRHLLSIRARSLVVAAALVAVAVCGIAAPHSAVLPLVRATDGLLESDTHDALVDLNGNEVRQAIAGYKVDPMGALYEEHSPDTEVPRLGSPKG